MGVLLVVIAALIGCAAAYRFGGFTVGPVWARWLAIVGAGIGLGIGFTGVVFFVARTFVPFAYAAPIVEALVAAWLAWEVYRMPRGASPAASSKLNWTLALGALAVMGLSTAAFSDAWEYNPQGSWDAFSIWNLRARIIAAPEGLAERAWSPVLSHTHPGYPMLLSSFIGRGWAYAGAFDSAVPILTSFLFFLGMICIGVGALAMARSASLAWAFGLVLAASPSLLHEVPAQYADIPLAYFFVAAVAMMLVERPVLAGIFAGLATFTKNEGVAFLVVVAVAVLLTARKQILPLLAGAAPAALVTAIFKLVLAAGVEPSHMGSANTGQIGTILSAYSSEFLNLGAGWYHPLLPVAALAVLWGIDKRFQRPAFTALGIAVAMLAIYFGVILFTRDDVTWQLGTALTRLYVQVWPTALFGCIFLLRSPDEKSA
ncbi:MAG TPA: hypothetical protein VER03_21585 [Bryobacteraceae bacterium]|nr:hypothetical protein [Bryobacteraceae bacterium]